MVSEQASRSKNDPSPRGTTLWGDDDGHAHVILLMDVDAERSTRSGNRARRFPKTNKNRGKFLFLLCRILGCVSRLRSVTLSPISLVNDTCDFCVPGSRDVQGPNLVTGLCRWVRIPTCNIAYRQVLVLNVPASSIGMRIPFPLFFILAKTSTAIDYNGTDKTRSLVAWESAYNSDDTTALGSRNAG